MSHRPKEVFCASRGKILSPMGKEVVPDIDEREFGFHRSVRNEWADKKIPEGGPFGIFVF